jgi:hypothetical protein
MKLFIANGTDNIIDFSYYTSRRGKGHGYGYGYPLYLIPVNDQIVIDDLIPAEIVSIVNHQHFKYGMRRADAFSGASFVVPYIYLVDAPIPPTTIKGLRDQNYRIKFSSG